MSDTGEDGGAPATVLLWSAGWWEVRRQRQARNRTRVLVLAESLLDKVRAHAWQNHVHSLCPPAQRGSRPFLRGPTASALSSGCAQIEYECNTHTG